jgi:hypothetical protein
LTACAVGYGIFKTPTFTPANNAADPHYGHEDHIRNQFRNEGFRRRAAQYRDLNRPNNNNLNRPNNDDDLNRIAADLLAQEERRQQNPNINTQQMQANEARARAAAQQPNAFQWNPTAQEITNAVRNLATHATAINDIDCPICAYTPANANQTLTQFWTLFGNCNHALCKTCKLKEININHPCPVCRGAARR